LAELGFSISYKPSHLFKQIDVAKVAKKKVSEIWGIKKTTNRIQMHRISNKPINCSKFFNKPLLQKTPFTFYGLHARQ
jgi:hypothetical protein